MICVLNMSHLNLSSPPKIFFFSKGQSSLTCGYRSFYDLQTREGKLLNCDFLAASLSLDYF